MSERELLADRRVEFVSHYAVGDVPPHVAVAVEIGQRT